MNKFKLVMLSGAWCAFALGMVHSQAVELEVTHWWTSGGEAAAVKVFADAFNDGGDVWADGAIAGGGSIARPVIISRILGGEPMGATQLNQGRQAEELIEEGLMLDLTELAEKEGWRDFVRPAKLLDSCTLDGKIYCVPINIHSFQWMWVSLAAYNKAGLEPPADWYEFVASSQALRGAGIVPLAVGGQAWQLSGMFGTLFAGLSGVDNWRKVYIDRDEDALRGGITANVWRAFGDARDLQAKNNTVQNWNDATTQVINGKAGAQIMGDWAQAEFALAGLTAGKEYDCLPGLGIAPVLDASGDAFYFPKVDDPEIVQAQLRMASMMMSAEIQVAFNLVKGSLPIRGDVDMDEANECMNKGLAVLENENNVLPSGDQTFSPDTQGQLEDLIIEFWSDPDMDPADAQAIFADIILDAD